MSDQTAPNTADPEDRQNQEEVQQDGEGDVQDNKQGKDDGEGSDKPPQAAGKKSHKMENEDAIPTAGGQRLGEEHWGESKIVPENPGKSDEENDGQPTDEVADNTAKNTGGASGGPNSGSGEKGSLIDKIKDKLPIGGKKD